MNLVDYVVLFVSITSAEHLINLSGGAMVRRLMYVEDSYGRGCLRSDFQKDSFIETVFGRVKILWYESGIITVLLNDRTITFNNGSEFFSDFVL